jgi:DHA1 family bicyclomycin/chloramphenicol resistance-like MFS transporter
MLPVIAFFAIQGTFLAAAPYVMMKKYGFTPTEFGLSNIVIVVGIFSGRALSAHLLKHHSASRVYQLGGILCILLMFLFIGMALGKLDHPVAFLGVSGFFATLYGMLSPIGLKSALTAFRASAGTAAALQGALLLGASAIGSALTGLLAGKTTVFSIHIAFAILSALFTLIASITAFRSRHHLN